MNALNAERSKLASAIKRLSYREGDFVLASGKRSNFYVDLKMTTLHPEGASLIGSCAANAIEAWAKRKGVLIGGVGGMTLGADPIATAVSLAAWHRAGAPGTPGGRATWPAYIVRKEPKGHGTGEWVEGRENLDPEKPLVVLEDVTTTGGSSVQAIERLRSEGLRPALVLTVVDREQGAAAAFAAAGVEFEALLRLSDVQSA